MNKILKIIATIFVLGLAIYIVALWRGCGKPDNVKSVTVTPKDTSYAPVTITEYTPSSLPHFLQPHKKELYGALPMGVSESDVDRIITIPMSDSTKKPVHIIETKQGEVFIEKNPVFKDVEITIVKPKLFAFTLTPGLGISAGRKDDKFQISPSACLSLMEWSGFLQIPTLYADIYGVGLGGQVKLYHDIYIGLEEHLNFSSGKDIRLNIHSTF